MRSRHDSVAAAVEAEAEARSQLVRQPRQPAEAGAAAAEVHSWLKETLGQATQPPRCQTERHRCG